ncbi:hypothetical protein GNP84_13670 [Aliivibrio fischeri]|uniref:toll/interleukin-1 receptor domain-containing protein n=1 Tax=Aliivibrio fischeri TaxID=668 RepID=UPI0012D95D55|nr:toll/interleukin-1 receptor domain-containing protein [Aliivibrio fischeri]MUK77931.1 hypothetical protein [Aliivibrio fischeri]
MFQGFNLKTTESLECLLANKNSYTNILEQNKKAVYKNIESHILNGTVLDAESIMNDWFPESDDIHVFISHSHKDIKLAEKLANWLYEQFNIKSFLDSHIWNYSNDLLKILDDKYAKNITGETYIYEIRNETTSHVHMMLSSALNKMIDNCETLFFLNTENAIENNTLSTNVENERTASPWIMSELQTSSLIRRKQNINRKILVAEDFRDSDELEFSLIQKSAKFEVSYPVKMQHLTNIDLLDLFYFASLAKNHDGYHALTFLYNEHNGCKFYTHETNESIK